MKTNRILVIASVLVILLMSVSVMYAQGPGDDDQPHPPSGPIAQGGQNIVEGALVQEAATATETTPREVLAARRNGQSIADYVTEHGGDPDAVALAVKTKIEEHATQALADEKITQERYDEVMANLDQAIADGLSATGPIVQPRNNGPRGNNGPGQQGQGPNVSRPNIDPAIVEILTEATGLDAPEIMTQLRDGKTLAELIEENGGDVEAIKAQVTEMLTTGIEERVNNLFTMPFNFDGVRPDGRPAQNRPFDFDLPGVLAEATGLEPQDLMAQLQDGKTPAELIEENGGDVEAVKAQIMASITEKVNEGVANENITQENADQILANLEERIDNLLNNPVQLRGRGGRGFDDSNGANEGVLE